MAGSLTQTSMLHCRKDFPLTDRVAASMAVVQSTSPHYWFLASLDSARQQLALEGPSLIGRALELARSVRDAIRAIPGLTVLDGKSSTEKSSAASMKRKSPSTFPASASTA